MKRTFTLFAAILLLAVGAAAQKLSYQAVVRNSANELVYDATVSVSLKILAADGVTVQYAETQTATTNQNGLLTLIIGEHPTGSYSLTNVNWTDASIRTDITLPTGDVVTNTMPVTAVPYALYADGAGGNLDQVQSNWAETNTASKAYIQNKPTIPTVPTNVSAFQNDAQYVTQTQLDNAGYLTGYTETDPQFNAWDKDYNDLTNKPTIPTVPTNVSAFQNDAGYLTSYTETDPQFNAWDKDYNDLTNKPTIPTVPTNVSAFQNDAQYVTQTQLDNAGYLTGYTETDPQFNAWDKDYNDLTNKPTIPTVPTNVSAFQNDAGYLTSYTETDPQFNAWDKDYNDLTNKPNIPVVNNATLTIKQGNATLGTFTANASVNQEIEIPTQAIPDQVNADWNATDGPAKILNKPTIPTVPTNVSAFQNDAGYLTSYTETDPQFNAWDKDYNDLTNKPAIPTVPTNVSAFQNDAQYVTQTQLDNAGYLTSYTETDPQFNAWDKDYNDLTNKPTIPTVPTNVSVFQNDAGYLTSYTETQSLADVTANGNSAGNRQLKNVSDPTDAQDAVTKSYLAAQTEAITASIQQQFDNLASQYQQQLGALTSSFQHQLDSMGGVIEAQQHLLDSLINGGSTPIPPTPAAPTATTSPATDLAATSATLNGTVSNPDNVTITAQGFEWKTTEGGTYAPVSAAGETMTYSLTGLAANTSYTYRAFVTTANGTSYGEEVTFTTLSAAVIDEKSCPEAQTVTDHEGNVYATVQIGNQCWMRDNLRTTTSPSTGTYLVPAASTGYTITGKQARWYNNDSATYAPMNYGLLYNWNAAVDTFNTAYGETSVNPSPGNAVSVTFTGHRRGICPAGWHLPSDAEWNTMEATVSGSDWQTSYETGAGYRGSHAGKLAGGDNWTTGTTSGAPGDYGYTDRDVSGFSAVPAGSCIGSSFNDVDNRAYFWSSFQHAGNPNLAWYRDLSCGLAGVSRYYDNKYYGYSVRCLRDESGNTAQTQPTATTGTASSITETSATLNGTITNPDNVTVTAQGFEWKATTGGTYTAVNATGETMTYSLTGLTASTGYTYRAFVTTANGTSYGEEVTFTTLSAGGTAVIDEKSCPEAQTVTDHEGNVYATVQIGNQCWMRDNLRTTTSPSTGTYLIPAADANYTFTGKQALWYGNDSTTYAPMNYGLLYNWNAAVDTFNTAYGETSVNSNSSNAVSVTFTGHRRGICPAGWHLPSDAEWTQLTDYVSGQSEYVCGGNASYIAKALASKTYWNTYSGTCTVGDTPSANNATGFSAVPAAGRSVSSFYGSGNYALFWSSTEYNSSYAYGRYLVYNNAYVDSYNYNKSNGYSVRCLRDESSAAVTNPTLTTAAATGVTATSATLNGSVASPDNVTITAQGFEWKATADGTYAQVTASGSEMTYNLTGLTANTSYTYRAFVTYDNTTVYGDEMTFTTAAAATPVDGQPCPGAATVKDYDNNTYNTVQIGSQCWLAQNLRTTRYSDGTAITPGGSNSSTTTAYYYDYSSSNIPLADRGYLYNWPAVMRNSSSSSVTPSGVQGICPSGWHVPSDAEWTQLTDYVSGQSEYVCGGNTSYIAKALASKTYWNTSSGTCYVGDTPSANNATGFGALPAGGYYNDGYNSFGNNAVFWSATEASSGYAWYRYLYYYYAYVNRNSDYKYVGYSVRCLRD